MLLDSFFFSLKIYVFYFLAALGLHCYTWAFSSCSQWGLLFVAVHQLLIAVASLDVEHGLQGVWVSVGAAREFSSCSSPAQ